jgi:hypothetical protein
MRCARAIQIIEMFALIIDIREFEQIHALAVYHLVGQIAARIDDKVAFNIHYGCLSQQGFH